LNELADLSFDGRELGAGARESGTMLHPQPIQLAYVHERDAQIGRRKEVTAR
jgi:hypothetical protein